MEVGSAERNSSVNLGVVGYQDVVYNMTIKRFLLMRLMRRKSSLGFIRGTFFFSGATGLLLSYGCLGLYDWSVFLLGVAYQESWNQVKYFYLFRTS